MTVDSVMSSIYAKKKLEAGDVVNASDSKLYMLKRNDDKTEQSIRMEIHEEDGGERPSSPKLVKSPSQHYGSQALLLSFSLTHRQYTSSTSLYFK